MTSPEEFPPLFDPHQFGTLDQLRASSRGGREQILLICCCDHYTGPDNLSLADPNRLTVVQNLAAAIPPAGRTRGLTTLASIEYAVVLRNARHAVICGHRRCGVLEHWRQSQPGEADSPWLSASERSEAILRHHVLQQAANLRSHQFIRHRLDDGRLHLHVWIVDDQTARIDAWEPSLRQFRTLGTEPAHQPAGHR